MPILAHRQLLIVVMGEAFTAEFLAFAGFAVLAHDADFHASHLSLQ